MGKKANSSKRIKNASSDDKENDDNINSSNNQENSIINLQESDNKNLFIVEQIIGKMKVKSKFIYLVKWKNFPITDSSWEEIENLPNATSQIKEFEALNETEQKNLLKSLEKKPLSRNYDEEYVPSIKKKRKKDKEKKKKEKEKKKHSKARNEKNNMQDDSLSIEDDDHCEIIDIRDKKKHKNVKKKRLCSDEIKGKFQ